jgi:hypothetical protein
LHTAALPPPSSSVNSTFLPSSLIVALCQKAKFSLSTMFDSTSGRSGSEMSISTPSPMQAPAARSIAG